MKISPVNFLLTTPYDEPIKFESREALVEHLEQEDIDILDQCEVFEIKKAFKVRRTTIELYEEEKK